MYIEYLGHSCFYIRGEAFSVVTDPFSGIGYPLKRVRSDFVLSSHGHFDHNNFDGVDCDVRVTGSYGQFTAIPCYHDEASGTKRGENNAFYFNVDGLNVLHLGDLGEPFDLVSASKFSLPVDVLFLPVGGVYTVDAKEAKKYADHIGARVTVIMHYKTARSNINIAEPEEYLSICGGYQKVENGFEITAENICNYKKTLIVSFD